jgi:hypothetical protein
MSSNPYYIRPSRSVTDVVDPLMKLYGIHQQGKQAALDRGLKEKELEQRGRISEKEHERGMAGLDLRGQELDVSRRSVAATEAQVGQKEREMSAHKQTMDPGRVTLLRGTFAVNGMDKAFEPALKILDDASKQGATRGETYDLLTQPEVLQKTQRDILQNLGKDYEKALRDGDSMKTQELAKLIQGVGDIDGFKAQIDGIFKDTIMSRQMEQQAHQAEIAKGQGGQWSQPFKDEYGNIVQQDMVTGQLKKVTGAPSGMSLEVGPDGTVQFRQGAGADMSRRTQGDVEQKLYNINEGIARLDEIAESYDPSFLQVGTRAGAAWSRWKDKLQGTPLDKWVDMGVSPEEREKLEEFSAFRRDALSNINLYIKEITGAQMSEKEAARLRKALPDPGEGILDGDSPSEFESKWKSTMKNLRLSQARHIFYLNRGLKTEDIANLAQSNGLMSIKDMQETIDEYGRELEKQGMKPEEIVRALQAKFFSRGQ